MSENVWFDELLAGRWDTVLRWKADRQEEGLQLEFKRSAPGEKPHQLNADDMANLAKTVSGFANTQGGLLVFGVAATRAEKGAPDRVERIAPLKRPDLFKDAVEKAVRAHVVPTVPSVNVLAVFDPADPGQGVVAVHVPQSIGGPHRVANSAPSDVNERYFMRTTSDTVIAPHSVLAGMFHARQPSALRLALEKSANSAGKQSARVLLLNEGRSSAREPAVDFHLVRDRGYELMPVGWASADRGTDERVARTYFEPHGMPIHPGMERLIAHFVGADAPFVWNLHLRCTLFCTDAPPVEIDKVLVLYRENPGRIVLPPPPPEPRATGDG